MDADAQTTAAPIAKVARRLQQEAEGHVRLGNQHRQRARTLYSELNELVEECSKRGIILDFIPAARNPTTHHRGVNSGNESTSETP